MKPNTFLTGALCALLCWACAPKAQNNSTLDTIFARKSVRTYTDQAVSPEQVETLLKAAMAAPSGINLQPWRFVVVTDQETKIKLAGPRNSMITQAPVVIVICGETTWTHKPWGEPDAPEACGLPATPMRSGWLLPLRRWAFRRTCCRIALSL